ncbi:MAG: hypothetical protein GXY01_10195 [Clostridiales bacterium]|nr:hypothetical protein [Clostridiales bacterium]
MSFSFFGRLADVSVDVACFLNHRIVIGEFNMVGDIQKITGFCVNTVGIRTDESYVNTMFFVEIYHGTRRDPD